MGVEAGGSVTTSGTAVGFVEAEDPGDVAAGGDEGFDLGGERGRGRGGGGVSAEEHRDELERRVVKGAVGCG